jgi:DNA-binding CsgD family transcriptional regulator
MEFYNSPDGKEIFFSNKGEFGKLTEKDELLIDHLLEMIASNYSDAYNRLHELYCIKINGNKPLAISRQEKFKKVRRFIRCNFLVSDSIKDVDDGRFNLENVICPLKGTGDCKDENCICNPILTTSLTLREIEIVKLICECLSDSEISDKLFVSIYTAENHRKNILRKLNLHSKEQIIVWAHNNGFLK